MNSSHIAGLNKYRRLEYCDGHCFSFVANVDNLVRFYVDDKQKIFKLEIHDLDDNIMVFKGPELAELFLTIADKIKEEELT